MGEGRWNRGRGLGEDGEKVRESKRRAEGVVRGMQKGDKGGGKAR